MNLDLLSVLTDTKVDDLSKVIHQGYIGDSTHNAGCWINTQAVNSICEGVVLAVERDPKNATWVVTVEVNSQRWVRYCGLSAAKVLSGAKVERGTPIGYAYKNKMKFEYCTSSRTKFPVRILSKQLYKRDPSPILFGQEIISEVT